MASPLVSVCIPAYRADKFIAETLASVRSQTYVNWELIVIEDGSHGETEKIVYAFAATVGQRTVYLRHDVNRGLPMTRNTALEHVCGEWIALLDADDLWLPTHLEDLVRAATDSASHVACSAAVAFDSDTGQLVKELPHTESLINNFPVSLYSGKLCILPSSALVKREAFVLFGPVCERFRICNDTELWFRFASRGAKFAFTRKATCRYRRHAGSMTKSETAALVELAQLYAEYSDWSAIPSRLRRGKAASLYRYAGRSALSTNAACARTYLLKSLRLYPFKSSTWYFLLRSWLPLDRAEPS